MSASTELTRAVPEPRHADQSAPGPQPAGGHGSRRADGGAARESVVLIVALGFVVSSVFVLLWPYC